MKSSSREHVHGAPLASAHESSTASHDRPDRSTHEHHEHHEKRAGHDRHAGHSVEMFRDRFWITLLLTVPTLVWSHMVQSWFRFTASAFPGSTYIPAVFGTAVYLYGGWPFFVGAARELRDRLSGMMTLIALAISVAFVFSLAVTLGYPRGGALVGIGHARHHHAARTLDRDALHLSGERRRSRTRATTTKHSPAHCG
jgi:Cu2+-exporting ATPase